MLLSYLWDLSYNIRETRTGIEIIVVFRALNAAY